MRIRSIKPEFWTSEDIALQLEDWGDRLLFLGLWSYVDDNGVGRDSDRLVTAALFPLEPDAVETLARVSRGLERIEKAGLIIRYVVDEKRYLQVTGWKHQKIDRPSKPRYPRSDEAISPSSRALDGDSRALDESHLPDQGIRGSGDQGSGDQVSVANLVSQLPVVEASGKNFSIPEGLLTEISDALSIDRDAALTVAGQYLAEAPGDVRSPGPYVRRSFRADPNKHKPKRPSPTKAQQCPKHPGQWADRCGPCAADRIAGDHDE